MEASHKTHRPHMKVGKDEETKKISKGTHYNWNNYDTVQNVDFIHV